MSFWKRACRVVFRVRVGVFLALVFCSVAACTTEYSGATNAQAANYEVDPEQVTCRKKIQTGTRLGGKVCMANRDWQRQADAARQATEQSQRRAVHTQPIGGS